VSTEAIEITVAPEIARRLRALGEQLGYTVEESFLTANLTELTLDADAVGGLLTHLAGGREAHDHYRALDVERRGGVWSA
jgi:hypothetical protein